MKTLFIKKHLSYFAIILLTSLSIFSSCSKKDEITPTTKQESPTTKVKQQMLVLNFANVCNNNAIDFKTIHTTPSGDRFGINNLRYYISNIKLTLLDNTVISLNKYILVNTINSLYPIDSIPEGKYKQIEFAVGVDSVTNGGDITKYPAGNPLAVQSPSMHWSWKTGYLFINFEGTYDATEMNNEEPINNRFSNGFVFHIGTNTFYKKITLNLNEKVIDGTNRAIGIQANWEQFFAGLDIKTDNMTHSMSASGAALAKKVTDNLPSVFVLKE